MFQECSREKRAQVRLQENDDGAQRITTEHDCLVNLRKS